MMWARVEWEEDNTITDFSHPFKGLVTADGATLSVGSHVSFYVVHEKRYWSGEVVGMAERKKDLDEEAGNSRLMAFMRELQQQNRLSEVVHQAVHEVNTSSKPTLLSFMNYEKNYASEIVSLSEEEHNIADSLISILKEMDSGCGKTYGTWLWEQQRKADKLMLIGVRLYHLFKDAAHGNSASHVQKSRNTGNECRGEKEAVLRDSASQSQESSNTGNESRGEKDAALGDSASQSQDSSDTGNESRGEKDAALGDSASQSQESSDTGNESIGEKDAALGDSASHSQESSDTGNESRGEKDGADKQANTATTKEKNARGRKRTKENNGADKQANTATTKEKNARGRKRTKENNGADKENHGVAAKRKTGSGRNDQNKSSGTNKNRLNDKKELQRKQARAAMMDIINRPTTAVEHPSPPRYNDDALKETNNHLKELLTHQTDFATDMKKLMKDMGNKLDELKSSHELTDLSSSAQSTANSSNQDQVHHQHENGSMLHLLQCESFDCSLPSNPSRMEENRDVTPTASWRSPPIQTSTPNYPRQPWPSAHHVDTRPSHSQWQHQGWQTQTANWTPQVPTIPQGLQDMARIESCHSKAIRVLTQGLFSMDELKTCSVTGRSNKGGKKRLDPQRVHLIEVFMKTHFNTAVPEVRRIIGDKCRETVRVR